MQKRLLSTFAEQRLVAHRQPLSKCILESQKLPCFPKKWLTQRLPTPSQIPAHPTFLKSCEGTEDDILLHELLQIKLSNLQERRPSAVEDAEKLLRKLWMTGQFQNMNLDNISASLECLVILPSRSSEKRIQTLFGLHLVLLERLLQIAKENTGSLGRARILRQFERIWGYSGDSITDQMKSDVVQLISEGFAFILKHDDHSLEHRNFAFEAFCFVYSFGLIQSRFISGKRLEDLSLNQSLHVATLLKEQIHKPHFDAMNILGAAILAKLDQLTPNLLMSLGNVLPSFAHNDELMTAFMNALLGQIQVANDMQFARVFHLLGFLHIIRLTTIEQRDLIWSEYKKRETSLTSTHKGLFLFAAKFLAATGRLDEEKGKDLLATLSLHEKNFTHMNRLELILLILSTHPQLSEFIEPHIVTHLVDIVYWNPSILGFSPKRFTSLAKLVGILVSNTDGFRSEQGKLFSTIRLVLASHEDYNLAVLLQMAHSLSHLGALDEDSEIYSEFTNVIIQRAQNPFKVSTNDLFNLTSILKCTKRGMYPPKVFQFLTIALEQKWNMVRFFTKEIQEIANATEIAIKLRILNVDIVLSAIESILPILSTTSFLAVARMLRSVEQFKIAHPYVIEKLIGFHKNGSKGSKHDSKLIVEQIPFLMSDDICTSKERELAIQVVEQFILELGENAISLLNSKGIYHLCHFYAKMDSESSIFTDLLDECTNRIPLKQKQMMLLLESIDKLPRSSKQAKMYLKKIEVVLIRVILRLDLAELEPLVNILQKFDALSEELMDAVSKRLADEGDDEELNDDFDEDVNEEYELQYETVDPNEKQSGEKASLFETK